MRLQSTHVLMAAAVATVVLAAACSTDNKTADKSLGTMSPTTPPIRDEADRRTDSAPQAEPPRKDKAAAQIAAGALLKEERVLVNRAAAPTESVAALQVKPYAPPPAIDQ